MDLHKQQQSLIFDELNASRSKLAEENQMLRDELAEAKMIIRLLKMRLDESNAQQTMQTTAVNNKETAITQGSQYIKAVERSKKKRYLFKQKTQTRREAFLNPRGPRSRPFSFRRSLSPSRSGKNGISPRSSFSPIVGISEQEQAKVVGSSFNDSQMEGIVGGLEKATISNDD